MKLEKILEHLNSFEKNSFLKIIDNILANNPKNAIEVDKILSDKSRDLKNMDNINVAKVFNLVQEEFAEFIREEFVNSTSQLDILTDLISRDGKCILKQDWFSRLYEKELLSFDVKLKIFQNSIENEKSDIDEHRRRDYKIYRSCLHTAYYNDEDNNQEKKITRDEQSMLLTLANQLGLSQEEAKLINYLIIPIVKYNIDSVINDLKSNGVIFFSKKTNTIFVADEIVRILRKTRGKEIGDKFFRRVLRLFREPQINIICKKHNVDWRLPIDQKIKNIINAGISFTDVLINDIQKENATLTEKKHFINEFCDKELNISPPLKGITVEEKVANLIKYFDDIEQDEKVGISIDGYEKLLIELGEILPQLNQSLKEELEFQEENVLNSHFLLCYNIKPRDVLEMISAKDLELFATTKQIKTRGDLILNILDAYKDSANLYLENYTNIGFRNLAAFKENGIILKEAEIGIKFEELTKIIFTKLGFNVDEELRKKLNTDKDKADIVINLGNFDIILIECKTSKDSSYNKFSSVSRQLKAYSNLAKLNNFKVIKSLLVASDFSPDFIKDCGLDYELNLSLITATTLNKILSAFKNSKLKSFPHNLLMRDVLIQEDRILTAMEK
jgi:ribosome-associated translation inhibitor RaiA